MTCYVGMAGGSVLEWSEIDTEIKTAGLKDVSTFVFEREDQLMMTERVL